MKRPLLPALSLVMSTHQMLTPNWVTYLIPLNQHSEVRTAMTSFHTEGNESYQLNAPVSALHAAGTQRRAGLCPLCKVTTLLGMEHSEAFPTHSEVEGDPSPRQLGCF